MELDVHFLNLLFQLFSQGFIVTATVIFLLIAAVGVVLAVKAHKRKTQTGFDGLIGVTGTARTAISSQGGRAFVHGEIWQAISRNPVKKGTPVIVKGIRNMVLIVEETHSSLI
jgi:membrane-bound serine protease (ClpP class)